MKQEDVERRQKEAKAYPTTEFVCQVCHNVKKNIHMSKFHWVCDVCESKADDPRDEL